MNKWDEEDDGWLEEEEEAVSSELLDKENEDTPPLRTYRTLAQMERDGEAAAKIIDDMLAADPNTPSEVILEEVRKHVRPISDYRPTDAEFAALRRADIIHTLRGGKKKLHGDDEDENDSQVEN